MLKRTNPLADFKEEMNYTYDELADVFGVSRSVVQRTMEGAYPHVPPAILAGLILHTGRNVIQVKGQYQRFLNEELRLVNLPFSKLDRETSLDDFDIWSGILLRMNGVNWVDKVPHLPVARLLKINVNTISKFYTGETHSLPLQILERIATIEELQEGDDV